MLRGMGQAKGMVVNGAGGRIVGTAGLNERQRAFVKALVRNGGIATAAASEAGYANPHVEGWRLMQLEHVRYAIHAEQQRVIGGELANLALGTLRTILEAPPEVVSYKIKLDASKTILDRAGHVAPKAIEQAAEGRKSLAEMSFEELGAYVSEARARVDAIEKATPIAPDLHPNGLQVIEVEEEGDASGTQGQPSDQPVDQPVGLEPDARPTPGGGAGDDAPLVVTPGL